jgi:hypothetical protein
MQLTEIFESAYDEVNPVITDTQKTSIFQDVCYVFWGIVRESFKLDVNLTIDYKEGDIFANDELNIGIDTPYKVVRVSNYFSYNRITVEPVDFNNYNLLNYNKIAYFKKLSKLKLEIRESRNGDNIQSVGIEVQQKEFELNTLIEELKRVYPNIRLKTIIEDD